MAQSLIHWASALLGMGGNHQRVADAAMSSTQLTSVYGVGGAAAITDHGADFYSRGMYKIRFKSDGGFSTANGQLAIAVSKTTTFLTRQLHPIPNPISAAAGVTDPGVQSFIGLFDNDPTTFRYARIENPGVVIGGAAVTFDYEILALP